MSATSQNKDKFEDFEGFKEKFRPKLTTDDCYTPQIIMDAVEGWVAAQYGLDADNFCRPFYPGGDYESEDYSGKVVVDNPPFSILSKIINYYVKNKVNFFLFSPTLSGLIRYSDVCTALVVGADVTFENGANIMISFVTNLEPEGVRLRTAPELYEVLRAAEQENRREIKKQMPKYVYPMGVVSTAAIYPYSHFGIDIVIPREESQRISVLDSQKEKGKSIFGGGLLISDRLKAEREKAEREKAEREKAEREKAERWELSEREREIIRKLGAGEL